MKITIQQSDIDLANVARSRGDDVVCSCVVFQAAIPTHFVYLMWNGARVLNKETLTRKEPLVCKVCQLGALLCSAIRLGNHFEFTGGCGNSGSTSDMGGLREWFSEQQTEAMEGAFERLNESDPAHKEFAPGLYGGDRMVAILKNIIRNKGTFKP